MIRPVGTQKKVLPVRNTFLHAQSHAKDYTAKDGTWDALRPGKVFPDRLC